MKAFEHPIGKRDNKLVFNAIMKLGKPKVHEIKKLLDYNAIHPIDKDPVSIIDYYATRYGELDDKVITDVRKPSNILRQNDPLIGHPNTMSRQTIHFHCKELIRERLIEYDKDTGRYWVPDRVKEEIRYFGVWFGEVAISRLFMSGGGMTDFVNRIGAYIVWVFIEAMAPSATRKASDKNMLAEQWIESAIPLRSLFLRFVERFKGLEVVKGGNISASMPAYEMEDISKLESKLKKLYPDIYRSLSETRNYMGIDRNKRTLSRQRPSRI